jgi:hypothetical protein
VAGRHDRSDFHPIYICTGRQSSSTQIVVTRLSMEALR